MEVSIIDISWIENKMDNFFYFMSTVEDLNVFDTDLVKVLLKAQKYTAQLTLKVFIPWCIYFVITLHYMCSVSV